MQQLTTRLVSWLREQGRASRTKGAVLGMSGGIDSSVAAVLCKMAFPGSTLGLVIPCHSIEEDASHARLVAGKFDIPVETVDISKTYDCLLGSLPGDGHPGRTLAEANLKPRLRMVTLYFYANRLSYLVVGSSNRDELGIGYFTKYGDGGVDVMPLGNLLKSQVRDLARHLGIPQVIIDKPPSAGLWAGQTDEQEMGLTYSQLDAYFGKGDVPAGARAEIESRMARSAHKRALPPVPEL